MSRDIRGEVIVALVAIALLMFALAFGVLVSLSDPDATPTVTPMVVVDSNVDTLVATMTATIMPTQTQTPSATQTASPTRTPIPTHTPSYTPRSTEFSPILPTATINATTITTVDCVPPVGWVRYVVPSGATLFSIAQAVGSSVSELQIANCLDDPTRLISGDVLLVPRLPASVPTNPIMPGMTRVGCNNPAVQINAPGLGQAVSGAVTIAGNALYGEQFGYYKLEIRADAMQVYNFFSRSEMPTQGGTLGRLDTSLFAPGRYWLRLVVVDRSGNVPADATCVIPIIID